MRPDIEPTAFVNNFWGTHDLGFGIIQTRIKSSVNTIQELLDYYQERISVEKEYNRKLDKLNHKVVLGSNETGLLKKSLDKMQLENAQMCKYNSNFIKLVSHQNYDKLHHFMTVYYKEVNKIESHMQKVLARKNDAMKQLTALKTKYQDDCASIKLLRLTCQTTWGKELERNEAKLNKLMATNNQAKQNYMAALNKYKDMNEVWVRDWLILLQNFYQLEVERIQLCKVNCFTFCNNIATLCVENDQSVDAARLVFAQVNPPKDLQDFGDVYGTGNKIPDPPEFVDFMSGYDETAKLTFQVARFANPDYQKILARTYSKASDTREKEVPPPPEESPQMNHPTTPRSAAPLQSAPFGHKYPSLTKVDLPPPQPQQVDFSHKKTNSTLHLTSPSLIRRRAPTDGSQYEDEVKDDIFSLKQNFNSSNGLLNYSNPTNYSLSSERNWASPRRREKQLHQFQEQINLKLKELPNPKPLNVMEAPAEKVPLTKDFSIDFIAKALEDLNNGGDGDITQYRRSVRRAQRQKEDRDRDEEFRKSNALSQSPFRPASDYVDDSMEVATRYESISFAAPSQPASPVKTPTRRRPKSMFEPVLDELANDSQNTCIVKTPQLGLPQRQRPLSMKVLSRSYTNLHLIISTQRTPVTNSEYVTKAKARYSYKPQNHGELFFKKGWFMYVIFKQEDNWFVCELADNCGERNGMVGLVPGNYLVEGPDLF